MQTHSHFRVNALPVRPQGFFEALFKRRKTKIIASVVGFYLVISGSVGFMLMKPKVDIAQASNVPVMVAAGFEINNIDAILDNNQIDGTLNISNQSAEDLNNVTIDLYSTKEAVLWKSINYTDKEELIAPTTPTTFGLLPIKKNSSVSLQLKGILKNKSLPNVALMAKISFDTNQGALETTSNRILIKLSDSATTLGILPLLKTDKLQYLAKEKVYFNLEGFDPDNKANMKLSISNKLTGEIIANTLECQSDIEGQCNIAYDRLEVGKYGAVFFDKEKNPLSQIANFEIKSVLTDFNSDFKANSNSTLELPFGSGSVNGQIAVLAQNVVPSGIVVTDKDKCTFQILLNGAVIQQFQTSIVNQKCNSSIAITGDPGIYSIRLVGSPIEKSFSYLTRQKNVLSIQKTSGGEKSQKTVLKLGGITTKKLTISQTNSSSSDSSTSTSAQTLIDNKISAKISIHRIESGLVTEISNLNNNPIRLSNFEESLELPSSLFDLDGNYQIFVTLDNGQISDFLNFEISDKSYSYNTAGIIAKSDTEIKLGQSNNFEINNLKFKNGKTIQSGTCENIITQSDSSQFTVTAEIKNGTCAFSTDKIQRAGNVTISNSKFNLSSEFYLQSDKPVSYGDLNMGYTPVLPNKTNKIIIGPVLDQFSNPVSQKGYQIEISSLQNGKSSLQLDIENGFGVVALPSSMAIGESLTFGLQDIGGVEILSKTFELSAANELPKPLIPSSVSDDERIRGVFETNSIAPGQKCELKVTSPGIQEFTSTTEPVLESKSCFLDFGSLDNQLGARNWLQYKVGNSEFNYIIDAKNDLPNKTFEIFPNLIDNGNGAINLEFLTSAILGNSNKIINSGNLEWSIGNKVIQTKINKGTSALSLNIADIDPKNLTKVGENNFLNIDIDAKASPISLAKTLRLNINLGKNTISGTNNDFNPILAQNVLQTNTSSLLKFRTSTCDITNSQGPVKSYYESGICLVQIDTTNNKTKNKLNFRGINSTYNSFEYLTSDMVQDYQFCQRSSERCFVDNNSQYSNLYLSFIENGQEIIIENPSSDPSLIEVQKSDAEPNRKYPLKISFEDSKGQKIDLYREIIGKHLLPLN